MRNHKGNFSVYTCLVGSQVQIVSFFCLHNNTDLFIRLMCELEQVTVISGYGLSSSYDTVTPYCLIPPYSER